MKIVFVCTGNASRSAAAEVVLRKMLADYDIRGVDVASCGTGVPPDLDREAIICRIVAEHGYEMGGKANPMSEELLNSSDLIIVMNKRHRVEVSRLMRSDNWDRIVGFNDFCFGYSSDLPDPHYQTEYIYRKCFETIERGCQEIIKNLN